MAKRKPFTPALLASALLLSVLCPRAEAVNLLSDPGFESAPGGGNQNLPGWTSFGYNDYGETDATLAHSGSNFFKVYQQFNGATNYDGIYQDYISGPGAVYTADGWAYTLPADVLAGRNAAWIEVSFRNANGNALALYRSAIITTNAIATLQFPRGRWVHLRLTNQYDPATYQLTNTTVTQLVAPDGTLFVRYELVFQGDPNNANGSVYFDDLNLVQAGGAPYGNLNIVWTDEFDGTNINKNIWTYDTGNSGWGNNELEYYTSRTNNAFEADGCLHIVAQKEAYNGASYTSARIKSQGLFSSKYGRIEWRAQFPAGTAFWPALWMLGTNINPVGWPGCGEIDVFENNGSVPAMAQGSIHSGSDATAIYNFPDGGGVTNLHTYTLDWFTNAIMFYVDGHLYETQTNWWSSTGNPYPFPFNQPCFLIMNLAIGGNYLNNPSTNAINAGSTFPAEALVDYVRIYNFTDPLRLAIKQSGTNVLLSWSTNIVCRLETQSNLLAPGGGAAWTPVSSNSSPVQITPRTGTAFYRLASP